MALGLVVCDLARAQAMPESAPAPPIRTAHASPPRDLGTWDDVFVARDQRIMFLLREGTLFALSDTEGAAPTRLVAHPGLARAKVVTCAEVGDHLWVFLQSKGRAPFAIDARSGAVADLTGPGLLGAEIQSFVVASHVGAAILMISGGGPASWPRPENRPLYFWIGLRSGRVVTLPIGWDLRYFTGDQRIAVFQHLPKPDERPVLQALDLESGEPVPEVPPQWNPPTTEFNWTEKWSIKPVRAWESIGASTFKSVFAGLSVNGTMFPFDLGTTDWRIQDVKAHDDVAGFRVRPGGPAPYYPGEFWVMPLAPAGRAERVATKITDFVMLGGGTCAFRSAGHGRNEMSEEAHFRTRSAMVSWNVLDGVERLPPLDKAFDDRQYARDQLSVALIGGFGGAPRDTLALAVFVHIQDEHISRIARAPPEEKRLVEASWRRAIVITSDGQRYMTDLLRECDRPDEIWLHDSGRVLTGTYSWDGPESRGVKVVETQLRLHDNPPTPK